MCASGGEIKGALSAGALGEGLGRLLQALQALDPLLLLRSRGLLRGEAALSGRIAAGQHQHARAHAHPALPQRLGIVLGRSSLAIKGKGRRGWCWCQQRGCCERKPL
jgi:hypothetical protein